MRSGEETIGHNILIDRYRHQRREYLEQRLLCGTWLLAAPRLVARVQALKGGCLKSTYSYSVLAEADIYVRLYV